ncbi:hypothetical protein FACS189413_18380 [Bacteroidia bacterium]|nr:hypothetical protein FACS189413_18380 [Bacteroidia bacterium]
MTKEKFSIEYVFSRISKNSLWNCLSTVGGLSEWFADHVSQQENQFLFKWQGHSSKAELIGVNPLIYIRFRWLDEESDIYFEFRLHHAELTGNLTLEVIDFAESDEIEDATHLWDTQIKVLRRKLGI